MDPNGDGFVYKVQVPPGFSNDGYYVDEFEFNMFGIPKLGAGDVNGDNQTGPNCGVTDVIPDTQGYSVYAVRRPDPLNAAINNLIFRFRIGDNANSIESWHILLDIDGLFGPGKDPNYTPDNPGFEVDITLIKKQNPGVFLTNIDGTDGCPNPFQSYLLSTNFQIAVADLVTCGDPDYFYDFYVPFNRIAQELGIDVNTGLRYVATTSSSATCSMSGSTSDIAGIDNDDPLFDGNDELAYQSLIDAQCPTAVINLCETCEGFNTGLGIKPTISPITVGDVIVRGTSAGSFVKLSVYTNTNPNVTDLSPPTWGTTPRESKIVPVVAGAWTVNLNGPLQNFDKVVAQTQLTIDGSSACDSFSSNSSTSTTIAQNLRPTANPQNLTTPEDTALPITLTATDANAGDVITYSIVTGPINGTLSCTNCSNPIYTPALNYNGTDSFTFKATDNKNAESVPATVTIVVTPVNDLPVANSQNVSVNEDGSLPIVLTASDVDGNTLTYSIVALPAHGTLSCTNCANPTYTPAANYFGPDSFTFKANDGTADSNIATVSITVLSVNDLPVATNLNLTTPEDTPLGITLVGSDIETTSLTYSVVTGPVNGTLSGAGANITYTPNANFTGNDSFTYQVNDGSANSNLATVTITVTPVNDAPVAINQSLTTPEETALPITLTATDPDAGAVLTYTVVTPPQFGILSGTGANLIYTPNANFFGQDSFTFRASDGTLTSNLGTIIINVTNIPDSPVANNLNVITNEDTQVSFTIIGTDPDGTQVTYTIVSGPLHGVLSGTAPNLTYTPASNYFGPDSFTFKVNDGTTDSNIATVSITVNPVNDTPIANNQSVTTPEDTPIAITLVATDVDLNPLTYTIVTPPAHGTLTAVVGAGVTYTPDANYVGPDSFSFKANDGTVDSNVATVSINVTEVNEPPVANNQSVVTDEDVSVAIALTASDQDGDALTFSIVSGPTNGTLSGTGANVVYTPNSNYNGPDSFTFKANDGLVDSNTATVSITVNPINDAPVAFNLIVPYDLNTPKSFTITGFDAELGNLTAAARFVILTQPANGVLSGTAPNLTYTPNLNFNSVDNLTFTVNDGSLESAIATVTFVLQNLVNDAPVAFDQTIIILEDQSASITLQAIDADLDPLTYSIVTPPAHGTLSCNNCANPVYTPNANYTGTDSFTFKANDGALDSNIATVSITVTPVPDAPIANAASIVVAEDSFVSFTLTGSDPDGPTTLTYNIVTPPAHGTLTGTAPNLTYTPDPNYNGSDSFTFTVNDGSLTSSAVTVSITVTPVNDASVASNATITTAEDTQVGIPLAATDIDGDALTYSIVTLPAHGTLSCTNCANPIYTPDLNYFGPDSFTFKANDGTVDSNVATVSITITPVNDAPVADNQSVTVQEDTAKGIILTGSDVEGDPITFIIVTQPSFGVLTGTGANVTYTPNTNYNGQDSFTFKVNDGTTDSNIATVSINVVPVNDPPVAVNDIIIVTDEDIAVTFTINTNDTDSDGTINPATVDLNPSTPAEDKTFTVPGEGTYTVDNAGNVTFTPALNYNGTTTPVQYTVKDNAGALSNPATIQITVNPINDPPVVQNSTVTINEDETVSICFTVTDIENDPSVFTGGVSLGGNGSLVLDPTAGPYCFLYTPKPDYFGQDVVEVTVCDQNNPTVCSTGIITININPVNDPPKVIRGGESVATVVYTTPEDTPLNLCFDVVDPEGGIVSVGTITNASGGGTLVQGVGGANELCFLFTPDSDFIGRSSWTVVLCDDANPPFCATFTINIDVTPVNDAPVTKDQTVSVVEDTSTALTLDVSDPDGDDLTYTIITNPTHGTITVVGSVITYTPDLDYNGPDSFTYKANDGKVDSNVSTVSITVTPVNDAPVISSIPTIITPEDTEVQICIGVSDVDGNTITYQSPVNVSGGGTMTPSTEFDFCYVFMPAKDFNGDAFWKFTVCDTGNPAKCTEVIVKITVTPVNDAPIAVDDVVDAMSATNTEGVNILANDLDIENDRLVLTITPISGPYHGTVTMNPDGTFTYKSDLGFMGTDSVRYQVCDTGVPSLCDEGLVVIEVGPAPFKIYNGLSPNGDNRNDYWRIDGIEAFPNNRVRVFDRYNNLIFETSGYNNDDNSWRGQTNHSMISGNLPEGTYYYSVDLGDGSGLYSGYVVLKKE